MPSDLVTSTVASGRSFLPLPVMGEVAVMAPAQQHRIPGVRAARAAR